MPSASEAKVRFFDLLDHWVNGQVSIRELELSYRGHPDAGGMADND